MWNWKFFLLALAANEASIVSFRVANVYRQNFAYRHFPPWACREPIPLISHLTHIPLYWSNLILLVLGFFWLPWLTVLVVFGCAFLFGSIVLDVLVIERFPLILQLILADALFLFAVLVFFVALKFLIRHCQTGWS